MYNTTKLLRGLASTVKKKGSGEKRVLSDFKVRAPLKAEMGRNTKSYKQLEKRMQKDVFITNGHSTQGQT